MDDPGGTTGKADLADYVLCPDCTKAEGREQYHRRKDCKPAPDKPAFLGGSQPGALICPAGKTIPAIGAS